MAPIVTFVFVFLASLSATLAAPAGDNSTSYTPQSAAIDHHGRATWFEPGLGNCGKWDSSNDLIVAIGQRLYDRNGGSNCDQYVTINYKNKQVNAKVRDSCPPCGDDDLDLSPAVFRKLDNLDVGVLPVQWKFQPKGWKP